MNSKSFVTQASAAAASALGYRVPRPSADDNNPEAILFVEAHKSDAGKGAPGSWKYGLARMSAAALTFRLGDSDVWTVPKSFGGPRETYYVFTRAVPKE